MIFLIFLFDLKFKALTFYASIFLTGRKQVPYDTHDQEQPTCHPIEMKRNIWDEIKIISHPSVQ